MNFSEQQGSEYNPMVKNVMRFVLYAGGGGVLKKVNKEALPRGPTSYPYTEKVPLLYTSYWKMVSISHTYSRTLHPFQLL